MCRLGVPLLTFFRFLGLWCCSFGHMHVTPLRFLLIYSDPARPTCYHYSTALRKLNGSSYYTTDCQNKLWGVYCFQDIQLSLRWGFWRIRSLPKRAGESEVGYALPGVKVGAR